MKKIITLLLAMTMCLCLINIKNNNIKAQSNDKPVLKKGDDFNSALADLTGGLENITEISFTKDEPTEGVDFDVDDTGSIKAVFNADNGIVTINCGANGAYANPVSNNMFKGLTHVAIIDFNDSFDTSICEYMGHMFDGCETLETLHLENFDTSKVTTMEKMFANCVNLTNLNLSNFNTSNVESMSTMFWHCENLEELLLDNFDTSKVTTMEGMFSNCQSLEKIDLSNFDTSKVKDMSTMFSCCYSLNNLVLGDDFDTSKVENMERMFSTCLILTTLDLSKMDTTSVKNADKMFQGCISLVRIYADSEKTYFDNATTSKDMFYDCESLVGQNGTAYDGEHLDKEYARIDGVNNKPGYFSNKEIVSKNPAKYLPNEGQFYIGDDPVDKDILSYNPNTKVVTMNNFVHDICVGEESDRDYVLIVPQDTKEIKILGNSSLSNTSEIDHRRYLIGIDGEKKSNFNFYFTGDGTLTLNNTYYECALRGNSIVLNGPTINAFAYPLSGQGDNAVVLANNLKVLDGEINASGSIGIALDQNEDSSRPSFEVYGGKVTATGTLAAFGEQLLTNKAVEPKATVVGASKMPFEKNLTSKIKLIEGDDSNKHMFAYFDIENEDIVYYAEFTKYVNPDPTPSPTKDESCEKVIGPSWHWNNKKGICEDTGVVKTATR